MARVQRRYRVFGSERPHRGALDDRRDSITIIVAGFLNVEPNDTDRYVAEFRDLVRRAREALVAWASRSRPTRSIRGGSTVAGTGLLANARYLPMGFAIAPDLHAPAWRRAVTGAVLADASFAIAHRRGGGFDTRTLEWASPPQHAGWVSGTAAGVAGASLLADPGRFGFDVLFPVFYLGLLLPELAGQLRPLLVALLAGAVTAALIPVAPEGVPALAGAAAALLGIREPA